MLSRPHTPTPFIVTTFARPSFFLIGAMALMPGPAASGQGQRAAVREVRQVFTTYPFSDPDPVPRLGRIYPYFRFDGFTSTGVSRSFTVVELENDYLRVTIVPEIGGKVWNAIDKATGKSMLYDNRVVKFRDVAMRGPWTSGGIEANYGIIGHTPNVATPIDYVTRINADGSVSCIIGALDLLTRTHWRLEVNLPADKAYFTTRSSWFNSSPLEQPYYTWMNAAIPIGDDLEFVYPGNRFIGHDGETGDWPRNRANGRDVSRYANNDFGGYKSYHVIGNYTDFFGAWWHRQDFGMVRYAPHDEKPGKKLWIWGLSRQGMIWENLLSDRDGQYAEVQSGRLLNQTGEGSTRTPFKHRGFAPHTSEQWTEYWFPVRGTGGMVAASPWGALNARMTPAGLIVSLMAVQGVRDTLTIRTGGRVIRQRLVSLATGTVHHDTLAGVTVAPDLHITLGAGRLEYHADPARTALSRPVEAPADFDWASAQGHYLQGKEFMRDREFVRARASFEQALTRDRWHLPSLGELASLHLRHGQADSAVMRAREALRVDTYDPLANYVFGVASRALGRDADARDGLDIASQSVELRVAAFTELSRLYMARGEPERAVHYADRALTYDRHSLDALQLRALALRLSGARDRADAARQVIGETDPLGIFGLAESWLSDGSETKGRAVREALRGEMPHETLLELGIWYHHAGRDGEAARVLSLAGDHAEVLYWRAWLLSRLGGDSLEASRRLLAEAERASPRLVFPFRTETLPVLRWALSQNSAWQTQYYVALLNAHFGQTERAAQVLNSLGDRPDFAPFYATRAQLSRADAVADWRRAMTLDSTEWRYARGLGERLLGDGDTAAVLAVTSRYVSRFADKPALVLLHVRALLGTRRISEAVALMDRTEILPAEGAAEAHNLYREANLLLAVERVSRRDVRGARALIAKARLWPERLGAGKPYEADLDERLENWMDAAAAGRDPGPAPPARGATVVTRVLRAWREAGLRPVP